MLLPLGGRDHPDFGGSDLTNTLLADTDKRWLWWLIARESLNPETGRAAGTNHAWERKMTMTECYACRHNHQPLEALPSRERIFDNGLWRVAHAFSSALPGWMVVVPRRHVLSLSELTASEAAALGPVLASLSWALEAGLGARKAYAVFFAEAEGFAHLHLHVIPRSDDLPTEHRGPHVFHYLEQPQDQWVSPTTMDQIADRLRPLLAEHAPNP